MENVKSKLNCEELLSQRSTVVGEKDTFEVIYRLLAARGDGEYFLMEISAKDERELVCIGNNEEKAREFYSMCVKGQVTPCTLEACAQNVRACVWEF